jgi:3-hydroxyisobutyrate dehydrogenase
MGTHREMNVAVLGTGIMGAPMARNLRVAGLDVRVWNRTIEKARPLGEDGIEVIEDAARAVEGADVVVTMLADAAAVRAVLVDGGALDAMGDGAVLCQTSTIGIAGTEDVAHECATRGLPLVDAPVLGTKQPAEEGKLVVLGSGPDDALERCEPVFEAVGAKTLRLGEAGAGTRLKLVVNHWLLALVDGLAETIDLAEAIDVDPRTFLETISGGPLGPAYADVKGAAMIERAFTPPSFPLALAGKDADLVAEAAERHDHAPGLLPPIRERIARAVERGHGEDDLAALLCG